MRLLPKLLLIASMLPPSIRAESPIVAIEIEPGRIETVGARGDAQLIATGRRVDGSVVDLTRVVRWSVTDPELARVAPDGMLSPGRDGRSEVVAALGSIEARAPVVVKDSGIRGPVSFLHDALPALSKAGCNQGGCHGTPTGKNGFRLSLRGFDPILDHHTLTREAGGRRTNRLDPESSLILLKGTGQTLHQGGQRFTSESLPYRLLRDWIAEGLRPEPANPTKAVKLEVIPSERVLDAPANAQQLVALVTYSDGSRRDVTRLARFSSADETSARVDSYGVVRKIAKGETAILVNYENLMATSRLIFLNGPKDFAWSTPPENNYVDRRVFEKLKLLRIPPSDLADDATFLRRVRLDVTGLPPKPEEVRAFLRDDRPDKRARLIDDLLKTPEYVDFWTLKWADRLGCNQRFTGFKGAYSYHRWIRDKIASNAPFDRFAREIVTAKGSNYTNPPASFYRRIRTPEDAAESVSQLFLGIRVQCARCHNHVAERWTQDDYYGFAAFFSQVRYKNGPQAYAQYNKEETVYFIGSADVRQPRTGAVMPPKPLGGPVAATAEGSDRREALADWLTAPDNPYFAKAAVNRVWFQLTGRGIVEPVDDVRDSNPPASAELLHDLADDFVKHKFDVKHIIRRILNSRAYQLSAKPVPGNGDDVKYFSHAVPRLLKAESLLDAISQASEVPEKLFHLPDGTRAAQIPDGEFQHPFLRTFGQPPRSVACECERESDSTLEQALQIVGGRTIHEKIKSPRNRIGRLLELKRDDREIVDELFLATLGRFPSEEERAIALDAASKSNSRRSAFEDLLWSLFNHPEFLFQH